MYCMIKLKNLHHSPKGRLMLGLWKPTIKKLVPSLFVNYETQTCCKKEEKNHINTLYIIIVPLPKPTIATSNAAITSCRPRSCHQHLPPSSTATATFDCQLHLQLYCRNHFRNYTAITHASPSSSLTPYAITLTPFIHLTILTCYDFQSHIQVNNIGHVCGVALDV